MSQTVVHPPIALVSAEWCHEPIAPCTLIPEGAPGILFVQVRDSRGKVKGTTYSVWILGTPGVVHGWRLISPKFQMYDVSRDPVTCDCPDAISRDREGGCKHVAALRMVKELPPLVVEAVEGVLQEQGS